MKRVLLAVIFVTSTTVAFAGNPHFRCLTDGVKAEGKSFFIFHSSRKKLATAVEMTNTGDVSAGYPVGTILQLFPAEAMVKRKPGFNPEGGDWEFFKLAIEQTKSGRWRTRVTARGRSEVANGVGSCQGCHTQLARDHDFVCEFVIGAAGLGLTDEQIAAIQAADPRCH
jgi:hypothetical protein